MSLPIPHPHANILKAFADDCNLQIWYWNEGRQEWRKASIKDILDYPHRYVFAAGDKPTKKPRKMCEIAGISFPCPEREAPPVGTTYWTPPVDLDIPPIPHTYDGDGADKRLLETGRVHLTKDAAIGHGLALSVATEEAIKAARLQL